METKKSFTCRNCDTPIREIDQFCSNCAQKNTDGRITFGNLFGEFISSTFNLDSKIFLTIRDLFVPGKLTMEYFKGKHKKYVHPVRLFLVTILFLIATQTYYGGDELQIGTTNYETAKVRSELTQNEILDQFSHLKDSIQNRITEIPSKTLLDSLESALYRDFERTKDSIVIGEKGLVLIDSMYHPVSKKDYIEMTEDELIEKYEVKGFWRTWMFTQQVRTLRDNTGFANFFVKNMGWTMFFMMPFLALLLKLFYYKSNKYYIEHLIFSFHTHAFVFLLFGITLHLGYGLDFEDNSILVLSFVWVLIYIYVAIWRVYQQKIGLTILKVAIINILYLFLFVFFLVISVFVGLILF